jgi:hypothetical protein
LCAKRGYCGIEIVCGNKDVILGENSSASPIFLAFPKARDAANVSNA